MLGAVPIACSTGNTHEVTESSFPAVPNNEETGYSLVISLVVPLTWQIEMAFSMETNVKKKELLMLLLMVIGYACIETVVFLLRWTASPTTYNNPERFREEESEQSQQKLSSL